MSWTSHVCTVNDSSSIHPLLISCTVTGFRIENGIQNGHRPSLENVIDQRVTTLITECWAEDPTMRPSFDEVREIVALIHAMLIRTC